MIFQSHIFSLTSKHSWMRNDPLSLIKHFYHELADPQVYFFSHEIIGNRVVIIITGYMIVVLDNSLLPDRKFEWFSRKWFEIGLFLVFINIASGIISFLKRLIVQFLQYVGYLFVDFKDGCEMMISEFSHYLIGEITNRPFR